MSLVPGRPPKVPPTLLANLGALCPLLIPKTTQRPERWALIVMNPDMLLSWREPKNTTTVVAQFISLVVINIKISPIHRDIYCVLPAKKKSNSFPGPLAFSLSASCSSRVKNGSFSSPGPVLVLIPPGLCANCCCWAPPGPAGAAEFAGRGVLAS